MAEVIELDPESLPDEGGAPDDFVPHISRPARSGAEVMMAGRKATRVAEQSGKPAVKGAMIGSSLAI